MKGNLGKHQKMYKKVKRVKKVEDNFAALQKFATLAKLQGFCQHSSIALLLLPSNLQL